MRTVLLPWAAACVLLACPPARSACDPAIDAIAPAAAEADTPRLALQGLVDAAARRSKAVGAASLLAEAARQDTEETRAAALPQATLSAQLGWGGSQGAGGPMTSSTQLRPTISLSAPLWDAGRQQFLTRWREQLEASARLGQLSATEQVALQAVTLQFDRSRYRLHLQVWNQYAQAACGLVDSLEQIVAADRGRASELAQARKTLQQVSLSRSQARSQMRLVEQRLRRLVGDPLPDPVGLAGLRLPWPELPDLLARAAEAPDMAALAAQGSAAEQFAQATVASQKPQAGWVVSASRNLVGDAGGAWQAGVSLSMPLLNPGARPAADAARLRAQAVRLQHDEALDALRSRLAEVHEQASAAMSRSQDVSQVLGDSQRVRDDTLQMWRQLGRRSLFDVMSAEGEHFNLRLSYVDALHDSQQAVALLWSLAGGVGQALR